jgi:hypothetical protein
MGASVSFERGSYPALLSTHRPGARPVPKISRPLKTVSISISLLDAASSLTRSNQLTDQEEHSDSTYRHNPTKRRTCPIISWNTFEGAMVGISESSRSLGRSPRSCICTCSPAMAFANAILDADTSFSLIGMFTVTSFSDSANSGRSSAAAQSAGDFARSTSALTAIRWSGRRSESLFHVRLEIKPPFQKIAHVAQERRVWTRGLMLSESRPDHSLVCLSLDISVFAF